ncbi:MAG: hypothetical protein MUC38_04185 [Cyclobacteriaceae bacterium]|nr:hypothetical protein [Cyclobacteriaceae bacterium]
MKDLAKKSFEQWKLNVNHPSLQFKKVTSTENIYSVRVGLHYRALGVMDDHTIVWFWIGSHEDYNTLLSTL